MLERYSRPEMARVWTLENKFRLWLEVEILACEAWARLGRIPAEAAEKIRAGARFSVQRILELEKSTRHDVIAFTRCVAESLGPESRYLHYGLTSSDVVDTAASCQLAEAVDIIDAGLAGLLEVLARQADKHRYTVMMGRTHGVHAEPVTLGLKFALWYQEFLRQRRRLAAARKEVAVGKLSGAVGSFANIPPEIEAYVCAKLGLEPAPVSSQVLQRDRHAALMTTLALIAASIEKVALEIRNLQRTETREVEEPFYPGQKGSSAMPHKRNPVGCEQLCGLARVVRANSLAALENVALWHERDISHSSAERVILPDSTILVDYMVHRLADILRDLHVYPEQMQKNIALSRGLTFSGSLLLALVDKGLTREEAYDLVQAAAMQVWQGGGSLRQVAAEQPRLRELLTEQELDAIFDLRRLLARVDDILARAGIEKGRG
ncbi:MAG: adenylosuccinate lyase [Firmicutes bacterium]|nr:adenylosuccinate lyase [Bacillota bacterium]HOB34965.1 adenylosuccinate lyase [Bacillota bacterium]HQE02139.1 adenylosuccinate lyase [Bacillota bacterium]